MVGWDISRTTRNAGAPGSAKNRFVNENTRFGVGSSGGHDRIPFQVVLSPSH